MKKVVIIMPTYNEKENISRMIDVLVGEEFPKIKEVQMHLLVVDDNSPDGTGKLVEEKSRKYPNLHLLKGEKQGLGMAYVRGMKAVVERLKADAVMEMDADFQHDPKYVKEMVKAYTAGADYVIGSRYVKGGSIPKEWELYRKAISYFGNLFARTVLWLPKIHDVTTGFRLTRVKGILDKIDLDNLMELKRFAFKVDLLFQSIKLAHKVVEVPIHFASRKEEKSKFSLAELVATYKVVLTLRLRESRRFVKFGIVGFIGYLINALGIEIFRSLPLTENLAARFLFFAGKPILGLLAAPSSWSGAGGAELAIISNFTLNNIWTFKDKKITSPLKLGLKFIQFNLTSIGAVVIQFAAVGGAALMFEDTVMVRQIAFFLALVFLIVPYNYLMYTRVIWKIQKK